MLQQIFSEVLSITEHFMILDSWLLKSPIFNRLNKKEEKYKVKDIRKNITKITYYEGCSTAFSGKLKKSNEYISGYKEYSPFGRHERSIQ